MLHVLPDSPMPTPRPRPHPGSAPTPDRPPIWVNGQQRPSFNIAAYGAYSLIATRAALGPALLRLSGATRGLQARIAAGAYPVNTARLGRAADYLPRRDSIAATVGGLARIAGDAAEVVQPTPPPPESLAAYDALWRARKAPASGRLRGLDLDEAQADPDLHALRNDQPLRPLRPTRPVLVSTAPVTASPAPASSPVAAPEPAPIPTLEPEPELATLLAIRNMLSAPAPEPGPELVRPPAAPFLSEAVSARPAAATAVPQPRKWLPTWTTPIFAALRRGTAFAIGWALIILAMPLGLTRAAIAHLEGRDLRDLVEDP